MTTLPLLAFMAPSGGGSAGLTVLLIQIAAFGAILYFLIIRPQSQARKRHQALLAGLKKNDVVVTAGGVIGQVREIKENRVTIESGTSKLVIDRSRIVQVGDQVSPTAQQS